MSNNIIVDSFVEKLGKNEFYTFMCGFGVALLYLSLLLLKVDNGVLLLKVRDIHTLLYSIAFFGLFATLIVYVIYLGMSYLATIYAKKHLDGPSSGRQKINVSLFRPEVMINYETTYESYSSSIHIFGLISASVICLIPSVWMVDLVASYQLSTYIKLLITFILFLVSMFVYIGLYVPTLIDYLKIDLMIAYNKIKITSSKEELTSFHNKQVDDIREKNQSTSQC